MSGSWSPTPITDNDPVTETAAFLIALVIALGLCIAGVYGLNRQDAELRDRCALVAEPAFIDECVRTLR